MAVDRRMRLGMRPERDLGAAQELDGRGAPYPLGPGGADLVARVELVEDEVLGVGGAGRLFLLRRAMRVKAYSHVEPVPRRRTLVGEE